jgi:uncharacterized membrane protein
LLDSRGGVVPRVMHYSASRAPPGAEEVRILEAIIELLIGLFLIAVILVITVSILALLSQRYALLAGGPVTSTRDALATAVLRHQKLDSFADP